MIRPSPKTNKLYARLYCLRSYELRHCQIYLQRAVTIKERLYTYYPGNHDIEGLGIRL
jgi:hypothetical protein